MKWSFRLGTFRSIEVRVHATFFILVGFVALSHWRLGHEPARVVEAVAFILAIFGCVVLHELGHALTARKYGIVTRDITLLPIGGVARLERMPEDPRQELWVALAGPAVNLAIALLLFAALSLSSGLMPLEQLSVAGGPFLERLMVVNVFLAFFNLLPAFPMDGGRVLRALLARRLEYTRATQVAAVIGQGMALLLAFVGVVYNPILLFIALFVWIGAAQESRLVQMKSALEGIPVRRVMLTKFSALSPTQTLGDAAALILSGSQTEFPVVEAGDVVGVLTREDLMGGLARHEQTTLVGQVMRMDCLVVHPDEMLDAVFRRAAAVRCRTLPVMDKTGLVGVVTMDNVGEFVAIQGALRAHDRLRDTRPVRGQPGVLSAAAERGP